MIIDPCRHPVGQSLLPEQNVSGRTSPTSITISRCNLNSGGTIVQMVTSSSASMATTCVSSSTLVPDQLIMAAVARPIVPKITTHSLAPTLNTSYLAYATLAANAASRRLPAEAGIVTIGGREIPYVPGMPGPHSLIESRPLDLVRTPLPKLDIPIKYVW